jgi:hypothetical protein
MYNREEYSSKNIIKRFGTIAIENGYINKEQFIEAIKIQLDEDLEGLKRKLIGITLYRLGYIHISEINEVLAIQDIEEFNDPSTYTQHSLFKIECDRCDEKFEAVKLIIIKDTGENVCRNCSRFFRKCSNCVGYFQNTITDEETGHIYCKDCYHYYLEQLIVNKI